MIVNVRESKARLSELVAKAAAGEEILIPVRGEPKARLVGVCQESGPNDLADWAEELQSRLLLQGEPAAADSSAGILDDLRQDRF